MITIETPKVAAGGILAGSIARNEAARAPARAMLWLVWRTEVSDGWPIGEGCRVRDDYRVVAAVSMEDGVWSRFELPIPRDGPVSHDGPMLRVVWELVAGTQSDDGISVAEHASFRVVPRAVSAA